MVAYLGTYGTFAFGGDVLPQAGTIVMQYTGHVETICLLSKKEE